ncbi:MAG: group III truncated hemoglobin [Crocinitomicaceae bacterium]|nr:group III truncated hemoglobin [Flavobacteriales bacterium]NQZ35000.1 group III truncated hemoglobin [Crocinitomicaceae bacterium]
MKSIETRADINLLVTSFYTRVRKDDILGPIFNFIIPKDEWSNHFEKLTDFWETALFGVPKFKGNPILAHRNVDATMNHSIKQEHFGRWLNLWFETIDSLYTGERAQRAKNAARNMATGQYLAMWDARPDNKK